MLQIWRWSLEDAAQKLNPYADYLDTRDPREVIEKTGAELARLVGLSSPEALVQPPAPGKWSVRDILCHLADTEIAFGFRLRQGLAQDHHVIQPFSQDHWAAPYGKLTVEDALAAFRAFRQWNILLIRTLTPEMLQKPITHPERGTMTLGTIVETMGGHDLNHLQRLEQASSGR